MPDSLAGHPALYSLNLHDNSLTSLPSKWQQPPTEGATAPLNYLRASLNRLEGGFPLALATYPNLTYFLLSENRLRQAGSYLRGARLHTVAGMARWGPPTGIPTSVVICAVLLQRRAARPRGRPVCRTALPVA